MKSDKRNGIYGRKSKKSGNFLLVSRFFSIFAAKCVQGVLYPCLKEKWKRMNKKRKEKLGDLLLDIVKYIITAVLLATWFNGIEYWEWYVTIGVILSVGIITIIGLSLFNDDKIKTKKRR